jgi:outer membrane protein TolC
MRSLQWVPEALRESMQAKRRISSRSGIRIARVTVLASALLAGGCALYHPLPLARSAQLAGRLDALDVELPASRRIDVTRPLSPEDVGWLALLNDPDLAAQRGELDAARADLLEASLLPNPAASVSYEAFLGGPGATPAWSASLTEDVTALLTYHARREAARATAGQVNAQLLWEEWQVAEKARLTALDLYWDEQSVAIAAREHDLLARELSAVREAVSAGNLDTSALAPLAAAQATLDQALTTLRLGELDRWRTLDGLLGLTPEARFAIAAPRLSPPPSDLAALIASLPQRRPDLIALQLGYRSSDRSVRAAVLGQFPALVLGGSWSQDTTNVRSAGPTATFDVPLFNRGQGVIAQARATRLVLHEQYQARLDAAVEEVRALAAQAARLRADLGQAHRAADAAESLASDARAAYAQGNLDQRSLADYETAAEERDLEAIALERSYGEVLITLNVSLARGLPETMVLPTARADSPPGRSVSASQQRP